MSTCLTSCWNLHDVLFLVDTCSVYDPNSLVPFHPSSFFPNFLRAVLFSTPKYPMLPAIPTPCRQKCSNDFLFFFSICCGHAHHQRYLLLNISFESEMWSSFAIRHLTPCQDAHGPTSVGIASDSCSAFKPCHFKMSHSICCLANSKALAAFFHPHVRHRLDHADIQFDQQHLPNSFKFTALCHRTCLRLTIKVHHFKSFHHTT